MFSTRLMALVASLPCLAVLPYVSAHGEVILDISSAPGFTVGDQLIANQVSSPTTDSGTSSATFTLDDLAATSVTMSLTYHGEG